jgi:hypothetical protein
MPADNPTQQGNHAMKKLVLVLVFALTLPLASCDKVGVGGSISHAFGSWAQVSLPDGCVAKQIAAEEENGVAVLCEDGRVFH